MLKPVRSILPAMDEDDAPGDDVDGGFHAILDRVPARVGVVFQEDFGRDVAPSTILASELVERETCGNGSVG